MTRATANQSLNSGHSRLHAQFSQMRPVLMAPSVAPRIPMNPLLLPEVEALSTTLVVVNLHIQLGISPLQAALD